MEPEWTKAIQSETICNFFYLFFVAYAVIAIISIVALIYSASVIPKSMVLPLIVQGLIPMAIAITATLFNYLICSRALLRSA